MQWSCLVSAHLQGFVLSAEKIHLLVALLSVAPAEFVFLQLSLQTQDVPADLGPAGEYTLQNLFHPVRFQTSFTTVYTFSHSSTNHYRICI